MIQQVVNIDWDPAEDNVNPSSLETMRKSKRAVHEHLARCLAPDGITIKAGFEGDPPEMGVEFPYQERGWDHPDIHEVTDGNRGKVCRLSLQETDYTLNGERQRGIHDVFVYFFDDYTEDGISDHTQTFTFMGFEWNVMVDTLEGLAKEWHLSS